VIKEAIGKIVTRIDLSEQETIAVMQEIMGGEATPAQIGAFITGLRMKGETVAEITGAARVMREKATRIAAGGPGEILVDTCGTGGDGAGTFNVSTAAALVVAGAGCKVAKHGNRSVSSRCGSADVLEALGVNLNLAAEQVSASIKEIGIGFLFAPLLHGAMKYAIGPRREIGIRTIFNILGPLTNPAGANVQVLGVYASELTETMAQVLARLGSKRALVVWGEGNLDEFTVTGETLVADMDNNIVTTYRIKPEDVGLSRVTREDIMGAPTAGEAAVQLREILARGVGPCADMVAFNAGAALMAAGKAETIREGVDLARETMQSGRALKKLEALIAFSSIHSGG